MKNDELKEWEKYASKLKEFMSIKLEDFDQGSESYKFKDGFPKELLETAK